MKATTVEANLGGAKRTLRFDLGAIEAYERATTFRMEDGTIVRGSALEGLAPRSVGEFTALIWACLHANAEAVGKVAPTRTEVRAWLGEDGAMERLFEDVTGLIQENSSPPREKSENEGEDAENEGEDGPTDPPNSGTGSDEPTPLASSTSA